MLILHQPRGPSWKKTPNRPTVDPFDVDQIIQIDRNPSGQIYVAPDLNTSCHLAASKEVAAEIAHRIHYFHGESPTRPELVHVSPDKQYNNFEDKGIFVQNAGSYVERNGRKEMVGHYPVKFWFERACCKGLFRNMKFTEKKRSSEEEGESPVLHFGYSKSNCNQYPALRRTQYGHVAAAPIMSGMDGLSDGCKEALLHLISAAELMCPEGHETFIVEDENTYRIDYRTQFNESLGASMDKNTGYPTNAKMPFITCEGFTIIIPLILSCHRDLLNDFLKGKLSFLFYSVLISYNHLNSHFEHHNSTGMNYVLQINSSVSLTRENFPNDDLYNYIHELLDPDNEYNTDEMRKKIMVPVSIICYSRKAVGESADKLLYIDEFCEDNTPFVSSKFKNKSISTRQYDISLLRQCLKVALKDHQSSRNVMATYETNSHINHAVQKSVIENYEKRISHLSHLYFGDNIPDYDLKSFEVMDSKYVNKVDSIFDNANAHYARECLNQKQRDIYCDRKEDYDSFLEKVLLLEDDTEQCRTTHIEELRDIVHRWYYRKEHNMERYLATREQENRNTLPPESYNVSRSHNHYPLPNTSPHTVKDLKETVIAMKPYFHNFSVFVSLLNGDENGRKGPLGKMIERSFDRYNHPLFKDFCLDEWYRFVCNDGDAHDCNIENFDKLLIDPSETYQGPKMLMPAGWNKIVSQFCSISFSKLA